MIDKACRNSLVAITMALLVTGCGDEEAPKVTEVAEPPATALLEFVPADTVFYFGSLEPFPASSFAELVDAMPFDASWASGLPPATETATDGEKMLRALYGEYIRSLGEPGQLAGAFGLGENWSSGLYMAGNVPVLRTRLDNRDALESTLSALEQKAGIEASTVEDSGLLFRRYLLARNADGSSTLDLVIAHDAEYAVITLAGSGLAEDSLDQALGRNLPAASLAGSGRLGKLVSDHGYVPFALGFLDHPKLVEVMTADSPPPLVSLFQALAGEASPPADDLAPFKNDACRAELAEIAGRWPQTTFGYTSWDTGSNPMQIDGHLMVESTNTELLGQLKTLRGNFVTVPAEITERPALVFSLGYNIDAVVPFTTWLMQSLSGTNYQCPPLAEMAANTGSQLGATTMVAGMAQGVKGLTVAVLDYQVGDGPDGQTPGLESLDALVALSAANPAALVAMAQAFLPMLREMAIPMDGSAMPLPLPVPGATGIIPMLAVKQGFITLFAGEGSGRVVEGLDGAQPANGLMAFSMDYKRYLELIELGMAQAESMGGEAGSDAEVTMTEEQKQMFEAMKDMDSVVDFTMDITDRGIEMTSGMLLYKPTQ